MRWRILNGKRARIRAHIYYSSRLRTCYYLYAHLQSAGLACGIKRAAMRRLRLFSGLVGVSIRIEVVSLYTASLARRML